MSRQVSVEVYRVLALQRKREAAFKCFWERLEGSRFSVMAETVSAKFAGIDKQAVKVEAV